MEDSNRMYHKNIYRINGKEWTLKDSKIVNDMITFIDENGNEIEKNYATIYYHHLVYTKNPEENKDREEDSKLWLGLSKESLHKKSSTDTNKEPIEAMRELFAEMRILLKDDYERIESARRQEDSMLDCALRHIKSLYDCPVIFNSRQPTTDDIAEEGTLWIHGPQNVVYICDAPGKWRRVVVLKDFLDRDHIDPS